MVWPPGWPGPRSPDGPGFPDGPARTPTAPTPRGIWSGTRAPPTGHTCRAPAGGCGPPARAQWSVPCVKRSPARWGEAASGRHNGGRTCPRRCWRPSTGRCLRLPRSVTARTARSYRFDPPGVPVPTSTGWWGLRGPPGSTNITCEGENSVDEDEFYGYDLEHISIDDETDGDLSLTEELTADIGPL